MTSEKVARRENKEKMNTKKYQLRWRKNRSAVKTPIVVIAVMGKSRGSNSK